MNQTSSCLIIGNSTLTLQCADLLVQAGFSISGIVTGDAPVQDWAQSRGIAVAPPSLLASFAAAQTYDYLFSIVNGKIIPGEVIGRAARGAINFHDGPLPRYAGFHSPAWAILNGEAQYGVTWHLMLETLDAGDILKQKLFDLSPDETAFTLNAKCYEAGLESFRELAAQLRDNTVTRIAQDMSKRSYYSRFARAHAAWTLDWSLPAEQLLRMARSLDWGPYPNPFGLPKLHTPAGFFLVSSISAVPSEHGTARPGQIIAASADSVEIATGAGAVVVRDLKHLNGTPASVDGVLQLSGLAVGSCLPLLPPEAVTRIDGTYSAVSRHESYWTRQLTSAPSLLLGHGETSEASPGVTAFQVPGTASAAEVSLALAIVAGRARQLSSFQIDLTHQVLSSEIAGLKDLFAEAVPLHFQVPASASVGEALGACDTAIGEAQKHVTYLKDLAVREPKLRRTADTRATDILLALTSGAADLAAIASRYAITVVLPPESSECRWLVNLARIGEGTARQLLADFTEALASISSRPEAVVSELVDSGRGRAELTGATIPVPGQTIPEWIDEQVARTPDSPAVVCSGVSITYADLNQRANRLAHYLRSKGAGPEALVAISMQRSVDLVVGLLGILKSGAAYVPVDPEYPAARVQHMLEDSGAQIILTDSASQPNLPTTPATVVNMDLSWSAIADFSPDLPARTATGENLAYVIYTSGSTGKPKGVMLTHRNVSNFFAGMDAHFWTGTPGVWLAVTSISFDISVLELFWTLARGFKVVVATDTQKLTLSNTSAELPAKPIDFSLFYFASGGGDAEGYRLLLEGAKFADRNGFEAVWTPERHFHAFGGIYPNPSVTSAAVAAVTSRVGIRAGSVVLPLHQPLRVAEEWSVVDNLSGGRVGISFASGWNHRDFVLAPDNYPNSKNLLFDNLEVVRRLWRGESIAFRDGKGNQSPVSVLPRPVQKELPVWITAAGNPETFRSAGKAGANLLTHLLGQKIEDLAAKIKVYRQAWKEAGHAGEGRVTLMLHSFVGPDADTVRETVRGPLTNYLKTSLDLIKNSPWSFPAFKNRPANSAELDLTQLSDEELQPILEYSFARYFETSGLFGTPDDAVRIAQNVSRIGVDEIACLIDFGIATQTVLDGLVHLNEVRQRCSQAAIASDDSLSGLMREHHVTHLQCTPSMARMMLTDRATKAALARLQKLLVGGEAITPALRDQLYSHLTGDLHNMYGPTETTVWSSTGKIDRFGPISLGSAIANTVLYIVDASMQPVPAGAEGELLIGGEGVARGYLKRPELTSERFIVDPLLPEARAYRTGDLVRLRQDGSLEFVGRLDHQIKIRGHRIELGDIENAMLSFSGVREAAALARDGAEGPELNAYVVPVNGSPIDVPALKNHMKALLPEYMMPAAFVQMASFPMTANGKVDRKAFPAPDRSAPVSVAATDTSSYSEVQTTIATVWRDLLKLNHIGLTDNFFDLGAHSILMVQAHSALRDKLSVPVSLIDMFRYPTVSALAAFVQQKSAPAQTETAPVANRSQSRLDSLSRRQALRQRHAVAGDTAHQS